MKSLEDEIKQLKKMMKLYQDHMDEGILMMQSQANKIVELEAAIKNHKLTKQESTEKVTDADWDLWDLVEVD